MGIFSRRRRKRSYSGGRSLLRWFGPGATTLAVLYGLYMLLTGGWSFSDLDGAVSSTEEVVVRGEPISLGDRRERAPDRIRIATFNIRQFAEKKSTTREHETGVDVLGKIAEIVSTFDLVAVQEIMGADGMSVRRLVALLNQSGGSYAATMSDPIGDDNRRESYAFIWDQTRVELIPDSSYVVMDNSERMYREPMVASFRARVPAASGRRPFRFTMINVHTDPDVVDPKRTDSEINVLADVFHRVREYEFGLHGEDDFILLGDLNVDTERLGALGQIPGVISVAGDVMTNVTRSQTYDHILIDRNITREYAERMGVIDFQQDLGLNEDQAKAISDHLPLWAEFSVYEAPPPMQQPAAETASRTRLIE